MRKGYGVLLEHHKQFDIFCLPFVVVCQLPKRYDKWEKRSSPSIWHNWLGKNQNCGHNRICCDFSSAQYLVPRFWSRAFLFRGIFSSRRQRRCRSSSRVSCHRNLSIIESFVLLPWTAGRHRSPRFVTTREESPTRRSSAGGALDRRLSSGPRPCIYVKFPPPIVKLPKLQNSNAKLLDTSFL